MNVGSGVQTDATTPNIVATTMLGVVVKGLICRKATKFVLHTRGFAPGACSSLILHVSVHTRERFQVRSICPGSFLPNI